MIRSSFVLNKILKYWFGLITYLSCITLFVAQRQAKRKYVTTHQLQQKQKNKMANQVDKVTGRNTQMLLLDGTRKSPRLNTLREITDETVCEKPASARRKLDLENPPHEDENMGENEVHEYLPPPPPLTEIEIQRATRVKMNNEIFSAYNLPTLATEVRNSFLKNHDKGKEQIQEGSDEDYDPVTDNPDGSNDDESGKQVKVRHLVYFCR